MKFFMKTGPGFDSVLCSTDTFESHPLNKDKYVLSTFEQQKLIGWILVLRVQDKKVRLIRS